MRCCCHAGGHCGESVACDGRGKLNEVVGGHEEFCKFVMELEEIMEQHQVKVQRCLAAWHHRANSKAAEPSALLSLHPITSPQKHKPSLVPLRAVPAAVLPEESIQCPEQPDDPFGTLAVKEPQMDRIDEVPEGSDTPQKCVNDGGKVSCAEPEAQRAVVDTQLDDNDPYYARFSDPDPFRLDEFTAQSAKISIGEYISENDASFIKRLVFHRFYEMANCTLVVANAAFLGAQTQVLAKAALEQSRRGSHATDLEEQRLFLSLQIFFTVVFLTDLALRWTAHGLVQFWRTNVSWNLLDFFVVCTGMIDLALEASTNNQIESRSVGANLSLLRMMRLLRIIRVARIIRVMRFFRDLRLMVSSIIGSAKSLMWVIVVVFGLIYTHGIIFTVAASSHIVRSEWSYADESVLVTSFGTLDASILSLFKSMTGGDDWGKFYDVVAHTLGQPFDFLFIVFILVAVFSIINVVTGVFVNNALHAASTDESLVVQEEIDAMVERKKLLRTLFETMDTDDSGKMSREQFKARMQDPYVAAFIHSMHLGISDANLLFDLLDSDRSGSVDIGEFLSGCSALMGEATAFDAKVLRVEVSSVRRVVQSILALLREQGSGNCVKS